MYYKHELSSKISIVEKQQIGIVWLRLHDTLFSFNEDVYSCCIYNVPNSSALNDTNVDLFECVQNGVEKYKSEGKICIRVILTLELQLKMILFHMTNILMPQKK